MMGLYSAFLLVWLLQKIRSVLILNIILCLGNCFGCSLLCGTLFIIPGKLGLSVRLWSSTLPIKNDNYGCSGNAQPSLTYPQCRTPTFYPSQELSLPVKTLVCVKGNEITAAPQKLPKCIEFGNIIWKSVERSNCCELPEADALSLEKTSHLNLTWLLNMKPHVLRPWFLIVVCVIQVLAVQLKFLWIYGLFTKHTFILQRLWIFQSSLETKTTELFKTFVLPLRLSQPCE